MRALECLNGLSEDYARIRDSSIKSGNYQIATKELQLAMMERQYLFYKGAWVSDVENWGYSFVSQLENLIEILPQGTSDELSIPFLLMDSLLAQRRLKLKNIRE